MSAQFCQACQNGQHCYHVTTNFSQCTCTGDCEQRFAESHAKQTPQELAVHNAAIDNAIRLLQSNGYWVTKDHHLSNFELIFVSLSFNFPDGSKRSDENIELVRAILAPQLDHIESCEQCKSGMVGLNIPFPSFA